MCAKWKPHLLNNYLYVMHELLSTTNFQHWQGDQSCFGHGGVTDALLQTGDEAAWCSVAVPHLAMEEGCMMCEILSQVLQMSGFIPKKYGNFSQTNTLPQNTVWMSVL